MNSLDSVGQERIGQMLVPIQVPVSRRHVWLVLISSVVAVVLLCLAWFLYPIIRYQIGPNHALDEGIECGDVSAVKAALDRGANVDGLPESEESEMSPLAGAAGEGKIEIVRLLLDRGADVNRVDGWGTPLFAAALYDKVDVVELMIARGANVNDDGSGGSTALWHAALHGKARAVKVLLAHGANRNTCNPNSSLLEAVETDHLTEVAEILKRAGAK
jgi:Ankyrin repeats (3 copies)/Ankyrin repeat